MGAWKKDIGVLKKDIIAEKIVKAKNSSENRKSFLNLSTDIYMN